MRRLLLLAPALLLEAAGPSGRAIVEHGNGHGALPCEACHGMTLEGNPSIRAPRLAGLPKAVTLASLTAIASGRMGENYVMKQVAMSLTPAERDAIATYLAGLSK